MHTIKQIVIALNVVGGIFSDEDPCERTAEGLLDFLLDLRNKNTPFNINEELTKIFGAVANKFIESKHICAKVLRVLANTSLLEKSKPNKVRAIRSNINSSQHL